MRTRRPRIRANVAGSPNDRNGIQTTQPGDEGRADPDAVLRALADPHRRHMLNLVRSNELAVGQIATHFSITQQAVSQHLHVLERAGLLTERRAGTKRLYAFRPAPLDAVRDVLAEFWPEALERLKHVVEQTASKKRGQPKP